MVSTSFTIRLCGVLAVAAVSAKPIRHVYTAPLDVNIQQQPLELRPMHRPSSMQRPHQSYEPDPPSSHSHLDAAPNSVGMIFTTTGNSDEDDVLHVWLPLGKRLETRDFAFLPLHPVTARITTMIHSTPQIANREHLEEIVCLLYPRYNQTADASDRGTMDDPLAIEIRRRDDLVHLPHLSERPWKEIEAYECS
ncbi:hypothetical protein LTR15_006175 [Elasticomyces elasticus]|nr:hypothetical protein LTR15_006175 [Elasticomyces elasticus]